MKNITLTLCSLAATLLFSQCNISTQAPPTNEKKVERKAIERTKPQNASFTYAIDSSKTWYAQHAKELTEAQMNILTAVNRTDKDNLKSLKTVIVPSDLTGGLEFYLPFPVNVPYLKDVKKIILFSYPSQTFGAYEYGDLVFTGPTNMGRKKDPTPEGLYYTNWKAEQTTSTFNDEWDLKWNFNIENKEGIGFHQYALPGYPASHSCLRLREEDAKYLYTWAEQWELKGTDDILAKGTPLIVFGSYDFDGKKPWLQLGTNPKALDITAADIEKYTAAHLEDILAQQKKRDDYLATNETK